MFGKVAGIVETLQKTGAKRGDMFSTEKTVAEVENMLLTL